MGGGCAGGGGVGGGGGAMLTFTQKVRRISYIYFLRPVIHSIYQVLDLFFLTNFIH